MEPEPQKVPNVETMGGCMFAGDLAIRKVSKKAILIVGDTRVGKSTLFNFLMRVPIIGFEVEDGSDVVYKPQFQKGVDMKNTFTSVTLVPNIGKISLNAEDSTLVDLAGFFDSSRSYVGIFGVSFMLERVLETIKEFKFMLAVYSSNFEMPKNEDFIKPFVNFVRIFQIAILVDKSHQKIRQQIIDSIAVVVIKSRQPIRFYLAKIKKAIDHMQKSYDGLDNQNKVVYMILKQVYERQRIELFKRAEPEMEPQQPQIIENLNAPAKKWKFFSFEDNLSKEHLFLLPFEKQHTTMSDADKDKYKNQSKLQGEKMSNSYKLLGKFLKQAKNNWYSQTPIDYSQQFAALDQFIRDHPYGSFDNMIQQLKLDYKTPEEGTVTVSRFNLLDKLQQIQNASKEINEANQNLQAFTKIHSMIPPCTQVFDILRKIVCTTREQELKFITFMFINVRYLLESQVQNKVDKNASAGVPFIVSQAMSNILPNTIEDLSCQFLIGLQTKSIQREHYRKTLDKLISNFNLISDPELAKKLLYANVKLNVKIGEQFMKNGQHKSGLQSLLKANKDFHNFLQLLPIEDTEKDPEDKNLCEFKQIQLYNLIAECLEHLNFHRQAVKIYQHTNSIYLLMKCYEKKIDKEKGKKKKYEFMEDYIQVLERHKKMDKVIQLYERMIDEFPCFPQKRRELKQKLINLSQANNIIKDAGEQQRVNIEEVIGDVESELAYHVDNVDEQEIDEDEDYLFEHRNDNIEKDGELEQDS